MEQLVEIVSFVMESEFFVGLVCGIALYAVISKIFGRERTKAKVAKGIYEGSTAKVNPESL